MHQRGCELMPVGKSLTSATHWCDFVHQLLITKNQITVRKTLICAFLTELMCFLVKCGGHQGSEAAQPTDEIPKYNVLNNIYFLLLYRCS